MRNNEGDAGLFRSSYDYHGRTYSGNIPWLSPQTSDANFTGNVYSQGINVGIDYKWAAVELVPSQINVPNDSEQKIFSNVQVKFTSNK